MWTETPALAGVFLDSAESAYALARQGLPLLGLCALFFALNITFIGNYQSCERAARVHLLHAVARCRVPGAGILPASPAVRHYGTVAGHPGLRNPYTDGDSHPLSVAAQTA